MDIKLEPGEIRFAVTVTADAPMVEADSSALGVVVDGHKIDQLPLNGRDFFQLAYLVPGAVFGAEGSQNMTQGGSVSVHGMREQMNNFLLDGVDNNDQFLNQVSVPPPLDSVQEFKVQSGVYNAEFGSRSGAQLNFVTRSGSNRLRLSLYEYHRNAALDAKNFFDPSDREIPKFIRNQFGFSMGGPIVHDKTFFFSNFEGLRERKALTRLATVPATAWVGGDFSSLETPVLNPKTGSPFPGNIIPAEELHPIGSAIAQFYPAPNSDQPGGNFASQPVGDAEVNHFVFRLDHELSEKDSLFGRYALFDEDRFNPFDPVFRPTNLPGFGAFRLNRGQNVALSWTRTFTAAVLNEARVGYNRRRSGLFQENHGNDITSQLGIKGLSTNPLEVGFPLTRVVGFDALAEASDMPQQTHGNTFHLSDSLSWQKGRHQFKFGLDMRHYRSNFFLAVLPRGSFNYTGAITGNPLADLLVGTPTFVVAPDGNTQSNFRTWSNALYVQDTVRLRQNLTLNLGLRYEYHQPPTEQTDRLTVPDLTAPTPRFIPCGTEGIPRACYDADKKSFAPRIGLAWSPLPQSSMVVRAGYGIFSGASLLNYNIFPRFSPPNFGLKIAFSPSLEDPFGEDVFPIPLPITVARDTGQPYGQHWTLSLQQEFARDHLLEVAYVGTKGTRLPTVRNPNQPAPGGTPPFPAYGPITYNETAASSTYHALVVRGERRFREGLSFLASYTLSKSLDDGSSIAGSVASRATTEGGARPQNSHDRSADRSLSDFDSRHRLVLSQIWEIPLGQGRRFLTDTSPLVNALLGGWQLTGIVTFQSARPFTPLLIGTSDSNTDNGEGSGIDRPNLIGNPHLANPDPAQWVNRAAFERPQGTFGDAGRNILKGPGYQSWDLGLSKQWEFSETSLLQFRAEFFNLLNHPNFDLPVSDWNSQDFGRVQSAGDSRQIQFGLRLEF